MRSDFLIKQPGEKIEVQLGGTDQTSPYENSIRRPKGPQVI